jgi:hypothetical protein
MQESSVPSTTTTPAEPPKKKKRNWLIIVIIIVCIILANGAIQMWRDSNRLDQLSRRMPGLPVDQPQSTAKRITNPTTGCNFILPRNWEPHERPNKPVVYIGPTINQSTPNLQMLSEAMVGTLEEYVQMSMQQMKSSFKQFALLEEAAFTTDQGMVGKRVIIQFQGTTHRMKLHYYYLPQSEKVAFIMCGSMSEVYGDSLTPLFDATARSVQLSKGVETQ